MARRRMFCLELISSDRFLSMEASAQTFYFHMCMHADDEGFVSAPNSLGLLCHGTAKDLELLEKKDLIIRFDSGVVVICDWYLHNTIRKDRSMETMHRAEKSMLELVNNRYQRKSNDAPKEDTKEPTTMSADLTTKMSTKTEDILDEFFYDNLATQNRIEQNRKEYMIIDHNRTESSSCDGSSAATEDGDLGNDSYKEKKYPSCSEIYLYCQDAGLEAVSPVNFWSYYYQNGWRDKNGEPVKDWKTLLHHWDAYAQQKADSS